MFKTVTTDLTSSTVKVCSKFEYHNTSSENDFEFNLLFGCVALGTCYNLSMSDMISGMEIMG